MIIFIIETNGQFISKDFEILGIYLNAKNMKVLDCGKDTIVVSILLLCKNEKRSTAQYCFSLRPPSKIRRLVHFLKWYSNSALACAKTQLCLFFALAPARAVAVKNIYANLELTNRFLLIIDTTGSCLFFCPCTSQGTSYQKYTQTLNS